MSALIKQFRNQIESQPELGIHFNSPLKLKAIQKFESKYGWELPDAVREMLTVFNPDYSRCVGVDLEKSLFHWGLLLVCGFDR
jgi:cell wall assembly regulator SMI1